MAAPQVRDGNEYSLVGRGLLAFLFGVPGPKMGRRLATWAGLLTLISWFPPLVLSVLHGDAWGDTVRLPFLLDLTAYARYLVAPPLLLMVAPIADSATRMAIGQFRSISVLPDDQRDAFELAVRRTVLLRDAWWVPLLVVVLVVAATWGETGALAAQPYSSWQWQQGGAATVLTPAGDWVAWVSRSLFYFLTFNWAWRFGVWTLLLVRISRMRLRTIATHPDQAGGLAFLGAAQVRLALVFAPLSVVVSAALAQMVRLMGVQPMSMQMPVVAYLVLAGLVVIGPLSAFVPGLARARREQMLAYGTLAERYVVAFHQKWVTGPTDEPILGSADIQSLADLGNSYELIRNMRPLPMSLRGAISVVLSLALPMLPCVMTVVPLRTILGQLLALVK